MALNQKVTGRASSIPGGLAIGAAVNIGITGGMTALLAMLLDRETIQWEAIGYGIIIMVMLSAFLGALAACGRIQRQRLLVCLMSGLLYFGILLSITALFFGGQYEAVVVTALLVAGGTGCAAMVEAGKGRGRKPQKVRKRYR